MTVLVNSFRNNTGFDPEVARKRGEQFMIAANLRNGNASAADAERMEPLGYALEVAHDPALSETGVADIQRVIGVTILQDELR